MINYIKFILGGGLFFILLGSPACDGAMEDLGDGYMYAYDYDEIWWVDSIDIKPSYFFFTTYVPNKVLEYQYDTRFIIVRHNCMGRFPTDVDADRPFFDRIPFREDSTTFWLIDKSTHFNSGPMDTISFANLCAERGVTLKFGEPEETLLQSFFHWLFPTKGN